MTMRTAGASGAYAARPDAARTMAIAASAGERLNMNLPPASFRQLYLLRYARARSASGMHAQFTSRHGNGPTTETYGRFANPPQCELHEGAHLCMPACWC